MFLPPLQMQRGLFLTAVTLGFHSQTRSFSLILIISYFCLFSFFFQCSSKRYSSRQCSSRGGSSVRGSSIHSFTSFSAWTYQYLSICPINASRCFTKAGAGRHFVIISATFSDDFTYRMATDMYGDFCAQITVCHTNMSLSFPIATVVC